MNRNLPTGWRLDKNVPVALLIALALQTSSGIWFFSKLDSRVATLEAKQSNNDDLMGRVIRIETKLDFLVDTKKPR